MSNENEIKEYDFEPVIIDRRILIALCQIAWLIECGKDISRCEDFSLIRRVAERGEIPHIYPKCE